MNSEKKLFLYRLFFCAFIIISPVIVFTIYMINLSEKIPEHIYLNEYQSIVVNLQVPGNGTLNENVDAHSESAALEHTDQMNGKADLMKPVTFVAGKSGHYTFSINLFGFISYRQIDVDVVDEKYVYPGVFQIGMYLHTDGALVVNMESIYGQSGESESPWKDLIAKGDYIIRANDVEIKNKEDLSQVVSNSNGDTINLSVRRNGLIFEKKIQPIKDQTGDYRLGLWVKDDAQGIGTVTYIDENNNFAALGHGINDSNVGNRMEISYGKVYRTHVMSIVKGKNGTPGELLGAIEYKQYNQIGTIEINTGNGIRGKLSEEMKREFNLSAMEIGYACQVHEGEASVRFYYKGRYEDYPIMIENVVNGEEKNITFKVTSDKLLELTNGIVQGMSGCPIIQDGKIIGAVTHVFIDDSTKGYGIFIEQML